MRALGWTVCKTPMCLLRFSLLQLLLLLRLLLLFSKCSTTTLFKVYFPVVFFLPFCLFSMWDRRTLTKSEGRRRKKISYRKGLFPPVQENLNIATIALKGMVYVPTAFSRQAQCFFASRIHFKLKTVGS